MITALLCENGQLSLTRVLACLSFIAFIAGTAYLMVRQISWPHYDTFATATIGGTATQVVNKFINSKFNSDTGKFPDKGAQP